MGLRLDQIGERRAVHVDADLVQLGRDQPVAQPLRAQRIERALHLVERRQVGVPMRRPHPLHPAALLVDQDRRLAAQRLAKIGGQAAQLIGRLDVAGEEDEAPRVGVAEERRLVAAEPGAFGAEDRGGGHRTTTGMQAASSATSAEQKRRASARSAKPVARSRKKVRPPLTAS